MTPFFLRCPNEAENETRSVTVPHGGLVPAGTYAFLELFCPDSTCDCQRVVISVVATGTDKDEVLATLNYGWASEAHYRQWSRGDTMAELMRGVSLEPLGPQSSQAEALAQLFQHVLRDDRRYEERLRRHYRLFKAWRPA